jgi:hypothetical protein
VKYLIIIVDTTGQHARVDAVLDAVEATRLAQRVPDDAIFISSARDLYWNWEGGALTIRVP